MFIIVLFLVLLNSNSAYGQTLDEVVVTGKRVQLSIIADQAQAEASMRQVAGGGSVLGKREYSSGRAATMQDVLGMTPGVFIQQRDTGAQEARLSIRGSGLQRTFHLRGIALLQDGIVLNQADGAADLYKIDPLAVDYIEVFRGSNALRYGATTLGGAINFVSPTGYTADRVQARIEGGSFGYLRSQLSSGEVLGISDYYLSLSQFNQDGFRDHTTQDNHYEFANFGIKPNVDWESRFFVTNAVTKAKLGGSLRKSQLLADPTQANAVSVSGNQKRDIDFFRFANKTTYASDDQQWDFTAYWARTELIHPIFQVLDQDADDIGADVRYSRQWSAGGLSHDALLGFAPSLTWMSDDRFASSGGNKGARTAENDQKAYNLNFYAQDRIGLNERLHIIPGVQITYASRQSSDYFTANGDDSGQAIYRAVNPKAGVTYDVNSDVQIFGGYTRGFEPPTFSELFDAASNFLANKAQISDTWEMGVRGAMSRIDWDAAYYYSRLKKELLSLNDALGNPLGTVNARGTTVHQGIELGAAWHLTDALTLNGVYNLNRLHFKSDPVFNNNQLPSLPEHFFKLELLYKHPSGFYAGPNFERAACGYPVDMANTFFADPFSVWGLKAGYQTPQGLNVFVEAKNLTERTYAASTGIVANAAGADTNTIFNPGNGRAIYSGLEWKW